MEPHPYNGRWTKQNNISKAENENKFDENAFEKKKWNLIKSISRLRIDDGDKRLCFISDDGTKKWPKNLTYAWKMFILLVL